VTSFVFTDDVEGSSYSTSVLPCH